MLYYNDIRDFIEQMHRRHYCMKSSTYYFLFAIYTVWSASARLIIFHVFRFVWVFFTCFLFLVLIIVFVSVLLKQAKINRITFVLFVLKRKLQFASMNLVWFGRIWCRRRDDNIDRNGRQTQKFKSEEKYRHQ